MSFRRDSHISYRCLQPALCADFRQLKRTLISKLNIEQKIILNCPNKVSSCRVSFYNENNTDRADLHICRLPHNGKALTPIPSIHLYSPSADYSAGIFSLQSNYPQKNCESCEPKSRYICNFNSQPSVAFYCLLA